MSIIIKSYSVDKPTSVSRSTVSLIGSSKDLISPNYTRVGNIDLVYDQENNAIKVVKSDGTPAGLYTTGGLSAYGDGLNEGSGGDLIQTVYGYADLGSTFLDTNKIDTFNAYTIAKLAQRLSSVESGALTSVDWSIINGKPKSLLGYGITDAVASSLFDSCVSVLQAQIDSLNKKNQFAELFATHIAADTISADRFFGKLDWTDLISKPTTVSGYGITDAAPLSHISDAVKHITSTERNNWNTAYTNNHTHSNKTVIDGITDGLIGNWNTAYTFVSGIAGSDTDSIINKWSEVVSFLTNISETSTLDGIINGINTSINSEVQRATAAENGLGGSLSTHTGNQTIHLTAAEKTWLGSIMPLIVKDGVNIKVDTNLYTTGGLSAYGDGLAGGAGGGGLIQTVYGYADLGSAFLDTNKTNTFNAYTIAKLAQRLSSVESGALTSVNWSIINGKPTSLLGYGITDAVASNLFDSCVSVLQAQIDSLNKKNQFNELFATHIAADTISADRFFGKLDWTDLISKPTTVSGYGITDVKIVNGVITLGSATITPLTTHQSLANYVTTTDSRLSDARNANDVYAWAKSSAKPSYVFSEIGNTPKSLLGYGITDAVASNLFDSCVSVLQAQIDNLNKKNQFAELYSDFLAADTLSSDLMTVKTILIGDLKLVYDQANNALKLTKADGSAVNLLVTGGMTCYA